LESVALSRFIGAADGEADPPDGAPCCIVEPDGASRPAPGCCALAKPVPAISAAAATEIIKRLVMEYLLTWFHCPRQQRNQMCDVPRSRRFRSFCFVNA
jgi:hypothetical protein